MAGAASEWKDVAPELHVRVFQWNILADSRADDTPQGFPYVPKEALDNELRRPMQFKEILADDADVLALEEVDNPHLFEELLKEKGYHVLYHRREDSPLGELVAYKTEKYTLKAKNMITFTHEGKIATLLLLSDNLSGRKFVFGAAQLTKRDEDTTKKVRDLQTMELLGHVKNMSDDWEKRCFSYNKRDAEFKGNIVLVGDMNHVMWSDQIKLWTDADGFVVALPENYDNTTFKVCKGEWGKVTKRDSEDFVIHNGTTARVRKLRQDFEDPYLPSKDFPSDHLSLCADIVFTN